MPSKTILLMTFSVFVLTAGCSTLKGTGEGLKSIGQGIKEDVSNTWANLKTLDEKFKENLW